MPDHTVKARDTKSDMSRIEFKKTKEMINFVFLEGMTLSEEEMVIVHGGISVAATGSSHCGSGCDGGGGNHCGKDCRPLQQGTLQPDMSRQTIG